MQAKHLSFIFIFFLSFLPSSFAQDLLPRPVVRLIYFFPNDRAPQPDIDEKIDALIKDAQQFYAQHMENHGFGRKTFLFETDAQGKAIVHHVKGRFNHTYYQNNGHEAIEPDERFDEENHYIDCIVLDVNLEGIRQCGWGGGNGRIGSAVVTTQQSCFDVHAIAHELGHAFGLWHDYRPFGGNWKPALDITDRMITSFCAAEWLDAIPAFNVPQTSLNQETTIEMLGPPTLVAAPATFRFRFKVQDPDGLHQVQLHIRDPLVGHHGDSLLDYKGLKGVRSSTLEFVSSILLGPTTRRVVIESIDVHGYLQGPGYPVNLTPLLPPPEPVSIPDANLAAAVREKLGLTPDDILTTHTMLNLRAFDAINRGITDLTGIEHAHNLSNLYFPINNISDVSPLAGLTQLILLHISDNDISDTSPLAGVPHLRSLIIANNDISDISAVVGLTQLGFVNIRGNPLGHASINTHIPAMQAKGILVNFDNIAHPALLKISDDAQESLVGTITSPFIVEAQNERGQPMQRLVVKFAMYKGKTMLTSIAAATDVNGRAQTVLTLDREPGIYTVRATAQGIQGFAHFRVTATRTPADRRAEDVNGDRVIDVEDLMLVAASFGLAPAPGTFPATDVNGDGEVNHEDVLLVLAALEGAPAAPALDTQWTAASLQRWIAEAKRRNTGDAIFQRGIAALEQLLADLLPKETKLLVNYPNPFNPETWIPYQMAEPADVTLHIYSVNGALVRRLVLGYQPAGVYQSRTRAAYWNGRNEQAERVASGVYFYMLSAGDFSTTRKMLIQK